MSHGPDNTKGKLKGDEADQALPHSDWETVATRTPVVGVSRFGRAIRVPLSAEAAAEGRVAVQKRTEEEIARKTAAAVELQRQKEELERATEEAAAHKEALKEMQESGSQVGLSPFSGRSGNSERESTRASDVEESAPAETASGDGRSGDEPNPETRRYVQEAIEAIEARTAREAEERFEAMRVMYAEMDSQRRGLLEEVARLRAEREEVTQQRRPEEQDAETRYVMEPSEEIGDSMGNSAGSSRRDLISSGTRDLAGFGPDDRKKSDQTAIRRESDNQDRVRDATSTAARKIDKTHVPHTKEAKSYIIRKGCKERVCAGCLQAPPGAHVLCDGHTRGCNAVLCTPTCWSHMVKEAGQLRVKASPKQWRCNKCRRPLESVQECDPVGLVKGHDGSVLGPREDAGDTSSEEYVSFDEASSSDDEQVFSAASRSAEKVKKQQMEERFKTPSNTGARFGLPDKERPVAQRKKGKSRDGLPVGTPTESDVDASTDEEAANRQRSRGKSDGATEDKLAAVLARLEQRLDSVERHLKSGGPKPERRLSEARRHRGAERVRGHDDSEEDSEGWLNKRGKGRRDKSLRDTHDEEWNARDGADTRSLQEQRRDLYHALHKTETQVAGESTLHGEPLYTLAVYKLDVGVGGVPFSGTGDVLDDDDEHFEDIMDIATPGRPGVTSVTVRRKTMRAYIPLHKWSDIKMYSAYKKQKRAWGQPKNGKPARWSSRMVQRHSAAWDNLTDRVEAVGDMYGRFGVEVRFKAMVTYLKYDRLRAMGDDTIDGVEFDPMHFVSAEMGELVRMRPPGGEAAKNPRRGASNEQEDAMAEIGKDGDRSLSAAMETWLMTKCYNCGSYGHNGFVCDVCRLAPLRADGKCGLPLANGEGACNGHHFNSDCDNVDVKASDKEAYKMKAESEKQRYFRDVSALSRGGGGGRGRGGSYVGMGRGGRR